MLKNGTKVHYVANEKISGIYVVALMIDTPNNFIFGDYPVYSVAQNGENTKIKVKSKNAKESIPTSCEIYFIFGADAKYVGHKVSISGTDPETKMPMSYSIQMKLLK